MTQIKILRNPNREFEIKTMPLWEMLKTLNQKVDGEYRIQCNPTTDSSYSRFTIFEEILNSKPTIYPICCEKRRGKYFTYHVFEGVETCEALCNFIEDHPLNPNDRFYIDLRDGELSWNNGNDLTCDYYFPMSEILNLSALYEKKQRLFKYKPEGYLQCIDNLSWIKDLFQNYPILHYIYEY